MDSYHLRMFEEAVDSIITPLESGKKESLTQAQRDAILKKTAELLAWIPRK